MLNEDEFKNLLLQTRQRAVEASAWTQGMLPHPIDNLMTYNGDEPGRKARRVHGVIPVLPEPRKAVATERTANFGKRVHNLVMIARVVANRGENQSPILYDEKIPSRVRVTGFKCR
jgi:hypothetical protein